MMTTTTYEEFSNLFSLAGEIDSVEPVSETSVPEPYHSLLVHRFHMTVTVESFFRDRVDVVVLESHRDRDEYAREILLSLSLTNRIVQFGIVRIDLSMLPRKVSEVILSEKTPLGRVLIEHGMMTTIEPISYLKVSLGPTLCHHFGCEFPSTTYGRIGEIAVNGRPAIDVLEVLVPGLAVPHHHS